MRTTLVVLLLVSPAIARAAEPPGIEWFGGYTLDRRDDTTYHGLRAGADVALGRWVALEVAAAGQRADDGYTNLRHLALMAGPRFFSRGDRLTPFVSVTAGVARQRQRIRGDDFGYEYSETLGVGAADAGLDVRLGRRLALRIQGGWLYTRDYVIHEDTLEREWQGNGHGAVLLVLRP